MEPLSVAASIAGLISLTGATLKITKEYIRRVSHQKETAQEFLQELDVLYFNLSRLDEFLRSEHETIGNFKDTSILISSTHSCRIKLNYVHDKLAKSLKGSRLKIRSLAWPWKVQEHRQMVSELRTFTKWVQFSMTIDGCTTIAKVSADILVVLRNQSESFRLLQKVDDQTLSIEQSQLKHDQLLEESKAIGERNEILNWISKFKHQQKHYDLCKSRVNGTGDWLLQETDFMCWTDANDPEGNTLWCPGIPGSGKTILTTRVIDYIKHTLVAPGVGLAHFYFDYKDHQIQSAELVLASSLRQIAESSAKLPRSVLGLRQRIKSQERPLQQQDLEQILLSVCADLDRTFFVIDALDECDNDHRRDLLRSLAVLQRMPSVKIFITSRPHLEMEITGKLRIPLQIEIGATDSDLRTFLLSQIEDSDNDEVIDGDFRMEIIDRVVSEARKMFLLAALQIKSILNKPTLGDMEEAMNCLPRDLDHAFGETLWRIQNQPEGQNNLGRATLMWITHAKRPLLVSELSEALAIKAGTNCLNSRYRPSRKRMVDCCMGLATVDEESSIIRLVHFSVQEYLYRCQDDFLARSEFAIAEACITYMLFEQFATGPRQEETEIESLLSENDLITYAVHYWGCHVKSAKCDKINQLAMSFLQADSPCGCSYQILQYTKNSREEYWTADEARSRNGLHLAAWFGLEGIGKQLLNIAGIGIDATTDMGTTALIEAAASGNEDFTEMLLDMQADKTKEDWYGTALHCAAESGKVNTILVLLGKGINVDIRDRRGRTSLHCATTSGHLSALATLLEHGADVNAICRKNYTPLRYAIVWEEPWEILRMLLENGASTEIRRSHNVTLLHDVVSMNMKDTTLLLLEYIADVHAEDAHGGTPLHYASERGYASIIQYLLDYGARIDARAHSGMTALHFAAQTGREEAVKVLLRNGANSEIGDEEGSTPLDIAIQESHEATELLLAAGAKSRFDTSTVSCVASHADEVTESNSQTP